MANQDILLELAVQLRGELQHHLLRKDFLQRNFLYIHYAPKSHLRLHSNSRCLQYQNYKLFHNVADFYADNCGIMSSF